MAGQLKITHNHMWAKCTCGAIKAADVFTSAVTWRNVFTLKDMRGRKGGGIIFMTNQVEVAINQIRHFTSHIYCTSHITHFAWRGEKRGAVCRRSKWRRSAKTIREDADRQTHGQIKLHQLCLFIYCLIKIYEMQHGCSGNILKVIIPDVHLQKGLCKPVWVQ